jgi:inositol-phosphate phosphatase/L-galactose 1-phosphate phosphatase/histidinol-phosphatase
MLHASSSVHAASAALRSGGAIGCRFTRRGDARPPPSLSRVALVPPRLARGRAARHLDARAAASSSVPPEYVALANDLVDAAGAITTSHFRTSLAIDDKNDASPVTIADRDAESAMRAMVRARCPSHAIFGEEHGIELGAGGESEWTWVFDPIDGTKSFITGKPLWGTLAALLRDGVPVLGVLDQPVLKERWVGVAGERTTLNGEPIATRKCAGGLAEAYMYATTPLMFEGDNLAPYERVAAAVKVPMYGCDCYAYGLLAAGHCDVVVEADLKPYDYMALVPIVKGAGGRFTDWAGEELRWEGSAEALAQGKFQGEVCVAGDEETHAQALEAIRG